MERQLAHHARTGEPAYRDTGRLKDWMQLAEQRFTVYRQLERRIEDHWKRRYLMQNPGFEGPGVVRRGGGAGRGKVWLEDLLLDAEASLPAGFIPRQRGRFRVIEVDLDRHRVRVEHVGEA